MTKAADQGDASAPIFLAFIYLFGDSRQQDYKKTTEYLEKTFKSSTEKIKQAFYSQPKKQEQTDHSNLIDFNLILQAANEGETLAQFYLGMLYYKGDGLPKDNKKALEFLTTAAERGCTVALLALSMLYKSGNIGEQSYKKAADYIFKAALIANKEAAYHTDYVKNQLKNRKSDFSIKSIIPLPSKTEDCDPEIEYARGIECYLGINERVDYKKAFDHFTIAANKNNAKAQFYLADMYDEGYSVNKDIDRAMSLLIKSAENGYAPAQFYLGMMHAIGFGVEQSYSSSLEWLTKAAEQDYAPAMVYLVRVR